MKHAAIGLAFIVLAGATNPAVSDVLSLGNGSYMLSVNSREIVEVQTFYKQWYSEAENICNSPNYQYSLGLVEITEGKRIIIQRGQNQKSTVISGPQLVLSGSLEC